MSTELGSFKSWSVYPISWILVPGGGVQPCCTLHVACPTHRPLKTNGSHENLQSFSAGWGVGANDKADPTLYQNRAKRTNHVVHTSPNQNHRIWYRTTCHNLNPQ